MNGFQRFMGHFQIVTHHRHLVIAHCAKAGIFWQGLLHDLSKYSPSEFFPGVRHFNGSHSPTEDERSRYGYSAAWMHHKGRNKHHWEYWTDYNANLGSYKPVEMPRKYVAEMLCDRIAASKVYKGNAYTDAAPLEYLQHGKMRDSMHPGTLAVLTHFLTMLKENGEASMFAALRAYVKEKE